MFLPVKTRTTGRSGTRGSAASVAAAAGSARIPTLPEPCDTLSQGDFRDEMEVVDGLAQPFDRAGDGDTNCQPVGDRVATVRLDGASRAPALVHHRSSF